jgi:hypothetical protein
MKSSELIGFVDNVCRYQKGEPLVYDKTKTTENSEVEHPNQHEGSSFDKDVALISVANTEPQTSKGTALQSRRNKQKQTKSRVPPPTNAAGKKSATLHSKAASNKTLPRQSSTQTRNQERQAGLSELPSSTNQAKERVVPKSHPERGKAKIVCGCFGTKHGPLTNCLYCGRISCSQEGYGFCPFCGFMVEQMNGDEYVD